MTNEESLDRLRECLYYAKVLEFKYMTVSVDALEVAVKTLEKQIPAEVKRPNKDDYSPCCPNCGTFDIGWADGSPDAYCWKCGQKLDWGV